MSILYFYKNFPFSFAYTGNIESPPKSYHSVSNGRE